MSTILGVWLAADEGLGQRRGYTSHDMPELAIASLLAFCWAGLAPQVENMGHVCPAFNV